jgi:hypothetical protein
MTARIAMLLGRCVWTRGADGWTRESFEGGVTGAAAAVARLGEILSEDSRGCAVVFEPEGIAHQSVESPRVGRAVFASLARVRSEFPVVESKGLGWGIEAPEPVSGGTYSTLMHSELVPGMIVLVEACSRSGSRFEAAWPAFTAAIGCFQSHLPAARPKHVVMLFEGFVGVATCTAGKRSFKSWTGPMSERDWKAFSLLVGDADSRSSPSMGDAALRRGGIAVIVEGDAARLCPMWEEFRGSGRIGAILDMDAFAKGAARIPRHHPANLLEAFPMPQNLNRFLVGALTTALIAALALGAFVAAQRRQLSLEAEAIQVRASALGQRLDALTSNEVEMTRLSRGLPGDPDLFGNAVPAALVGLSAAVPDELTLTSLVIRKDSEFEIEAMVVGAGFDADGLRLAIEHCGLSPDPHGGWVFDAGGGKLAVRGRIGAPRT